MGVLDKMKNLVGIEDFDEEAEFEEEIKELEENTEKNKTARTFEPRKSDSKPGKVLEMQRSVNSSTHPFKMVLIQPVSFDEAPAMVSDLKAKKPVIVNLEGVDGDVARKIFDFLNGAVYALGGNVQKITSNIFVFAPANVDINAGVEHKQFDYLGSRK